MVSIVTIHPFPPPASLRLVGGGPSLQKGRQLHKTSISITFNPDGSWSYVTDTELKVEGQTAPFAHQDRNTLHRIGEARPNPWAAILARRRPG
jgi:hypothetical protein